MFYMQALFSWRITPCLIIYVCVYFFCCLQVDYILYTPSLLRVNGYLETPRASVLSKGGRFANLMPNPHAPSDHFMLLAELKWL
jgi:hypothetical protein